MAIGFLELVDRLEVSVKVVAGVVPRVSGVMNVLVGPDVRQVNLAGVGTDVGECIQNVAASV